MEDSEHLKWIHDRIVNEYGESKNIDFLIKMREIIIMLEKQEKQFNNYLKFVENKNKMKRMENNNDRYCVRRHMFFAVTNPIMGDDLTLEEANTLVDELTAEELDSTYVSYQKHLIE